MDIYEHLFNGEHNSAPVYQIERITKNGEPVWINTHMITIKELSELEQTEKVKN